MPVSRNSLGAIPWASSGGGTITHVQDTGSDNLSTNITTCTITPSSAFTSGNTVILSVQCFTPTSGTLGAATDTSSNSWTNIYGDASGDMQFFICRSVAASAPTITFTNGADVQYGINMNVSEWHVTGSALTVTNSATEVNTGTSTTSASTNSLTASAFPALYIASLSPANGGDTIGSPSGGFSALDSVLNGNGFAYLIENSSSGAQTCGWTQSVAQGYIASLLSVCP